MPELDHTLDNATHANTHTCQENTHGMTHTHMSRLVLTRASKSLQLIKAAKDVVAASAKREADASEVPGTDAPAAAGGGGHTALLGSAATSTVAGTLMSSKVKLFL